MKLKLLFYSLLFMLVFTACSTSKDDGLSGDDSTTTAPDSDTDPDSDPENTTDMPSGGIDDVDIDTLW